MPRGEAEVVRVGAGAAVAVPVVEAVEEGVGRGVVEGQEVVEGLGEALPE